MPQPATMKAGSPDNFQTDPAALDYLLPFIPKNWHIWEPACGNGNLVRALDKMGFRVQGTDIQEMPMEGGWNYSRDFISDIPIPDCDMILTNPPYSIKEKFLARCYELGKPFALLLPLTTFDSVERRKLFAKHGVQIIFPSKRINFETPNHEHNLKIGKKTSAWFFSAWFTQGLNLKKDMTFTDTPDELI